MKVVILAGGYGTRISEYSSVIPKPLVPVGGKPLITHIMEGYASQGFKEFYIACGYKGEKLKEYFLDLGLFSSILHIDLKSGAIDRMSQSRYDWDVHLIDTGVDTLTGGRLRKLRKMIGNETFLMTYGDGLSNVDLPKLVEFHKKSKRSLTLTAVHPTARFGELELGSDGQLIDFKEKPQMKDGWINGGFFVVEPKFLEYLSDMDEMLEREPFARAMENSDLGCYRHSGFWYCMDTVRDKENLEKMWVNGAPWPSL